MSYRHLHYLEQRQPQEPIRGAQPSSPVTLIAAALIAMIVMAGIGIAPHLAGVLQ